MTTTDRTSGARLLRHLREARGWSWADLARALLDAARQLAVASLTDRQPASIERAIARWESVSDKTGPSPRYRLLLAHLYARTPAGDFTTAPESDFELLLDALRHFGTPPQRIEELIAHVSQSAQNDRHGTSPPTVDDDLINRLHESVTTINAQVGTTPFVRLQLQLAPIIETCRRLIDHLAVRPDLALLATTAYSLAARLAFETRDDEAAMALYADATRSAGRLEDRSYRAAVRTSHTMVTLHATDNVNAARTIARTATVDAHHGPSYAIRARAHAVHAEICARAGQPSEAAVALERAWKIVEQSTVDDPHGGFNADRLRGFDGLCALHAGNADHAHDSLGQSVSALRLSRDAVQLGIVSTDLALARLRLGDPVACADLLHKVVDITATTGGRVATQRIRLARRDLRPWRNEDFLAELDDHIHDTLLGR